MCFFFNPGPVWRVPIPNRYTAKAKLCFCKNNKRTIIKVELPYTKDSFDADAQTRFLSAVASSVETPVGNLYIKSVVERTSSRRVLRKLLAVSVEVDFAIRVPDAAAQAAMIANEGLTAGRLNAELAKQVSPFLRTRHAWPACSEFHCAARDARAARAARAG
jgi:hypothetical protein